MKTQFKKEWTKDDFKTVEKAIVKYLKSRYFETHHSPDATPFCDCKSFNDFDKIIGFAYTSTSKYAAYWACNTNLFLDCSHVWKLNGVVIGAGGFVFAIWNNDYENELIFPIN